MVLHILNTCKNFALALQYGSKYIYHTLPRLLTLWLDTAEQPDILRIEQSGGPVYVIRAQSPCQELIHIADLNTELESYSRFT